MIKVESLALNIKNIEKETDKKKYGKYTSNITALNNVLFKLDGELSKQGIEKRIKRSL